MMTRRRRMASMLIENIPTPWENLLLQRSDENITDTIEKLISSTDSDVDLRWTLNSSNKYGIKACFKSIPLELIENASWVEHQEICIQFSSFKHLPRFEISITLINEVYLSVFYHYCCSVIAKTFGLKASREIFNAVLSTINEWSDFFKKASSNKLSIIKQKGLIGELCFLNYLIDKKGPNSALAFWKGPVSSSKDFICDSNAFEIKCCEPSLASENIKISSLDQLLVQPYENLYLVIYELAPSSIDSARSFTLQSLVKSTFEKIEPHNQSLKFIFTYLLSEYGCQNYDDYTEYSWVVLEGSPRIFIVDNEFPMLTSENVPNGIIDIKYSISLSYIRKNYKQFLLEEL